MCVCVCESVMNMCVCESVINVCVCVFVWGMCLHACVCCILLVYDVNTDDGATE